MCAGVEQRSEEQRGGAQPLLLVQKKVLRAAVPDAAFDGQTTRPLPLQEGAPPELLGNRIFQRLRAHVKSQTDAHHSVPRVQQEGAPPKEWVRGWTDAGKEMPFADRIESR